ncbi:Serine protease easter [Frankliniella fusca]|uniref:CLIP domain-containing serine protease n=1 Tax=Frankliniella fusca TaxID=407009 RepID=A0AAE1GUT6_9NEOP|nr:Serine protease easter [Frankliniella fusca]
MTTSASSARTLLRLTAAVLLALAALHCAAAQGGDSFTVPEDEPAGEGDAAPAPALGERARGWGGGHGRQVGPRNGEACQTPDDKPGSCIPVTHCPPLVALLQNKPVSRENVAFLRNSQCGFQMNIPLVCCPKTVDRVPNRPHPPRPQPQPRPTPAPRPQPGRPTGGDVVHRNLHLLPTADCGVQTSERIFGGNETEIGEFPWMALLQYRNPRGSLGFYCGGVLISKRYVLTAAHCVAEDSVKLVSVRLGEHDTKTSPDCKTDILSPTQEQICADRAIDIPVERDIAYPEYNKRDPNHYHDIALVRLSRDVDFTEWIQPICVPVSQEQKTKSYVGKKLWVAGWGKTETKSESDVKLKLAVPVVSRSDCASVYSKASVELNDNSQLCAGGEKGRDSCNGDSGGPLMSVEQLNDGGLPKTVWSVSGVVAFGPVKCGMLGWPGVYTRVTHYVPWILDTIHA